jgi:hypothetical protein
MNPTKVYTSLKNIHLIYTFLPTKLVRNIYEREKSV